MAIFTETEANEGTHRPPTEMELLKMQLLSAYTSARDLELKLTHLIDRAQYYDERPTRGTLEEVKISVRYLKKILE